MPISLALNTNNTHTMRDHGMQPPAECEHPSTPVHKHSLESATVTFHWGHNLTDDYPEHHIKSL